MKLSKHRELGTIVVGSDAGSTTLGVITNTSSTMGAWVDGFRPDATPIVDWYASENVRKASLLEVGRYNFLKDAAHAFVPPTKPVHSIHPPAPPHEIGAIVVTSGDGWASMGAITHIVEAEAHVVGFGFDSAATPMEGWHAWKDMRKATPGETLRYNVHKAAVNVNVAAANAAAAPDRMLWKRLGTSPVAEDMPAAEGITTLRDALANAKGLELNAFTPKVRRLIHEGDTEYRARIVDHFASDLRAMQAWIDGAALKASMSLAVPIDTTPRVVVGERRLHIDCGAVRVVSILSISGDYALTSGGRVYLADTQPLTVSGFSLAHEAQVKAGINAERGDFVLIIGMDGSVKSGLSTGARDRHKLVLCKAPIGETPIGEVVG